MYLFCIYTPKAVLYKVVIIQCYPFMSDPYGSLETTHVDPRLQGFCFLKNGARHIFWKSIFLVFWGEIFTLPTPNETYFHFHSPFFRKFVLSPMADPFNMPCQICLQCSYSFAHQRHPFFWVTFVSIIIEYYLIVTPRMGAFAMLAGMYRKPPPCLGSWTLSKPKSEMEPFFCTGTTFTMVMPWTKSGSPWQTSMLLRQISDQLILWDFMS